MGSDKNEMFRVSKKTIFSRLQIIMNFSTKYFLGAETDINKRCARMMRKGRPHRVPERTLHCTEIELREKYKKEYI
jgi:hypothetical protein